MPFQISPVKPTDLVVLAPGVVVPALGSPEFIAAKQHRNAARDQQRQKEILDSAIRKASIPASVVSPSTPPLSLKLSRCRQDIFSVRFIVFVAIAHQVVQVKPSWHVTKLMLLSGPFRPV